MSNRPLAPARVEYDQHYVLRPVEPSDIPQIEKALDRSSKELRVFMAWSHHLQGRPQFLERVVTQWWNYYRGDEYEMGLFDKATGEFLVYTGFYPTVRINPNCFEIGYWTSTEHSGKGFATLATQIQIALIFEYFKGDRIEITSSLENKASQQVIKKCGFQLEGKLRNFYPQGTEEMFAQGYQRERSAELFAMIPEDLPLLPWYSTILEKLTIFPFLDPPIKLSEVPQVTKVQG